MANDTNVIQAAAEAFIKGADIEQAVYGTPSKDVPPVAQEAAPVEESESTEQDVSEPSTDDSTVSSEESQASKEADIEEIIVSDDSGRKKLKVDWNNRDQIKKYISMAAGMRKFQAERDKLNQKLSAVEPEYKNLKESWEAVQTAYNSDGIAGLINLVAGDKEAYQKHLQRELQRAKMREEASPAELQRLNLEEELAKERKEKEQFQKRVEDQLRKSETDREEASQKELKSLINPAFDKYRFAGKLGDSAMEHRLDKAIWKVAMDEIEEMPDSVELTPALVDKTFRTVAMTFKKAVNSQAEQKTKQVLEKKKIAAQEKVLSKTTSGIDKSSVRKDFDDSVKSGDWASAIRGLMTGGIKL